MQRTAGKAAVAFARYAPLQAATQSPTQRGRFHALATTALTGFFACVVSLATSALVTPFATQDAVARTEPAVRLVLNQGDVAPSAAFMGDKTGDGDIASDPAALDIRVISADSAAALPDDAQAPREAPRGVVQSVSANSLPLRLARLTEPDSSSALTASPITPLALKAAPLTRLDLALKTQLEPQRRWINLTVEPGDTMTDILAKSGADQRDVAAAIAALRSEFNPRSLRVGQEVKVAVESVVADEEAGAKLVEIALAADAERTVRVLRGEKDGFTTEEILFPLEERVVRQKISIDSSLFLAAQKSGIPPSVIVELIRMFSYDVDFQRDMRAGDTFEIFYSRYFNDANVAVREGHIRYAAISMRGKEKAYYRFALQDGEADYFDANGQNAKKFLMRTPIDGARLSSGFGRRMHPILGYTRMHTGTDFAAPQGTPIYAAGSGVVEMAQWHGGYGKFVRIRHSNGYKTAYGHMSRFASSIKKGTRVAQGQTIGYVGTTGRSTGPHLHYEVFVNNQHVNPMSVKLATGRKLEGKELKAFEKARDATLSLMAQIPLATDMAVAIDPQAIKG
jgi:murein DD-endopeptidase MepM/ murein hydrolase activator NlpD